MSLTKPEWALVGIVSIFLIMAVNVASYFIIKKKIGVSIYDQAYKLERHKWVKTKSNSKVHPFYGLNAASEQGFNSAVSVENNFHRVSPSKSNAGINVLVLGGSVASHLSEKRVDIVEDYMFSSLLNERFNTDRFVVYNAAFPGGKQPQQYFKLLYLELLGFTPDLIINYDGFNEVVVPFALNYDRGLNAIYPLTFDQSVFATASDGKCIALNNWLLSANTYIPVLEFSKWIYVRQCAEDLSHKRKSIKFTEKKYFDVEKENYLNRVKKIWADSSNRIYQFAKARNIPYIHVVQPNQYLENSKPLSKIEAEEYYDSPYFKEAALMYYHTLSMNELNTPHKLDQRQLFKSEERTVYSDDCCHFNRLGTETIINDILTSFAPVFIGLKARLAS